MKKTTSELLDILKQSPKIEDYMEEELENLVETTLDLYLKKLLTEKNISASNMIRLSGLDRTYTYQILEGKKHPSRDKLLAIGFALKLTFEEMQTMLKSTGYPPLYARIRRDSIIIFALKHGSSLIDTNELLYQFDFELIQ